MRVLGGRRASLYVMNVEDINKTLQTPREQLVVVLRLGVDHQVGMQQLGKGERQRNNPSAAMGQDCCDLSNHSRVVSCGDLEGFVRHCVTGRFRGRLAVGR